MLPYFSLSLLPCANCRYNSPPFQTQKTKCGWQKSRAKVTGEKKKKEQKAKTHLLPPNARTCGAKQPEKKTVNKLKEAARKSEINAFRCKLHKQPQSKRKKSTLEKKTLPS
jgi:hypothetical protein